MGNTHQIHCRRVAILGAIEVLRASGEAGITAGELATECGISVSCAKSYLVCIETGHVAVVTQVKLNNGGLSNVYHFSGSQEQIDKFIASDLISTKEVRGDPREKLRKRQVQRPEPAPGIAKVLAYADLPMDFFRPAPTQEAAA